MPARTRPFPSCTLFSQHPGQTKRSSADLASREPRREPENAVIQGGMTQSLTAVSQLSDSELLAEVKSAAARERDATVRLIALLAQLDERRLYLGEGCSSLFTYCTQVLHLSEHAAYGRIEAARAARRFPVILELLSDGSDYSDERHAARAPSHAREPLDVLNATRHKSKREVEHIAARLRPEPAVPATVRSFQNPDPRVLHIAHLSLSRPGTTIRSPSCASRRRPAAVTPLAPERYKVQFTVSQERTTSCAACRICCGILSRAAIPPLSSIGR